MTQSRKETMIEVITSKILGLAIGVITGLSFGLPITSSCYITLTIGVLTLIKSYIIRRIFNKRIKP